MTVRTEDIAEALAGRPALLRDACARALANLDGRADRPVAPAAADVAALARLDFALPGPGLDAAAVLALLDEAGSPATVASGRADHVARTCRDAGQRELLEHHGRGH